VDPSADPVRFTNLGWDVATQDSSSTHTLPLPQELPRSYLELEFRPIVASHAAHIAMDMAASSAALMKYLQWADLINDAFEGGTGTLPEIVDQELRSHARGFMVSAGLGIFPLVGLTEEASKAVYIQSIRSVLEQATTDHNRAHAAAVDSAEDEDLSIISALDLCKDATGPDAVQTGARHILIWLAEGLLHFRDQSATEHGPTIEPSAMLGSSSFSPSSASATRLAILPNGSISFRHSVGINTLFDLTNHLVECCKQYNPALRGV